MPKLPLFLLCAAAFAAQAAPIERIWLTHQTAQPDHLVVNWETAEPGDSTVEYGTTPALSERATQPGSVKLHHVEIPLGQKDTTYHYRVRSGADASEVHQFQGYPTTELRVAVVADTGYTAQPWADAIMREHPHLLLSAGDNVPALHSDQPVPPATTTAFSQLVSRWPQLYASTPWLPALGNHDREIHSRGPKPPPEPVYDVEATAFRDFFALPGEEWHWSFDVPDFGVRFVALDMSHLSDQGTTWQTCHPIGRDGAQFVWYRDLIAANRPPFLITLYNERNSQVRGLEGGEWGRMISQGSLAITGFGYFAERAEVDGFTYYNTSVNGTGAKYADPKSSVLKSEDNFVLLTFRRNPASVRVQLENLAGETLDEKDFTPRK